MHGRNHMLGSGTARRSAALAGLTALLLGAAPAAATAALPAVAGSTQPGDGLLSAAARDAVAEAGTAEVLRVVTVRADGATDAAVRVQTVAGPTAARAAIAQAGADPSVTAVSVDTRVSLPEEVASNGQATAAGVAAEAPAGTLATDPARSLQWGLDRLSAESAWTATRGAGVVVAVVDTGVERHPDLGGRVLAGVDLLVAGGDGTQDANGHGTHVAGIVAATADNGMGGAGLAPEASILPVRVLDASGSGWTSTIAKGVIAAADGGADVINLSLGSPTDDPVLARAVAYAVSRDAVVVSASGNSRLDGDPVHYPAAYPGVLAVAATGRDDVSGSFSSTGAHLKLAAPGVEVVSTDLGGRYARRTGTSMAAPFVSAAAALLRSASPTSSAGEVSAALTSTAADLEAAGVDHQTGYGMVGPVPALCALGVGTLCQTAAVPQLVPRGTTMPATRDLWGAVARKGQL